MDPLAYVPSGTTHTRTRPPRDFGPLASALEERLAELAEPPQAAPQRLGAALRYALLAPGKRIRPLLTYMVADPKDGLQAAAALDVACAVEMVHSASLLLDDLPCMDDATLRRGRPAAHLVFGEATAILSSIGLLSLAFRVIAGIETLSPQVRTRLASVLSAAIGTEGLVAGQELDVSNAARDPEGLPRLSWLKTGVLFEACAEMGALVGGLDEERTQAIKTFARHLGLAFQAHDDILDGCASEADAGKNVGQDRDKANGVWTRGVATARLARGRDLRLARQALTRSGVPPAPILATIRRAFAEPNARVP